MTHIDKLKAISYSDVPLARLKTALIAAESALNVALIGQRMAEDTFARSFWCQQQIVMEIKRDNLKREIAQREAVAS